MSKPRQVSLRPSPEGGGLLHASCVSVQGEAVVIIGASGSGKSAMALELMSKGADLVADDQVIMTKNEGQLIASSPAALKGRIEARFVGLLNASAIASAVVTLWVDLDQVEDERLPPHHTITCLGLTYPLLYRVPHPHFSAAVLQYLEHGREA
ncbi:MAG: HPr kinase/phosphatase C-terminal domain-containing protein [Cognatishimia sp.]|uniref:HPr kinase/phosphorylase n=1 Tax=Cognatishimia sp. TaxID=2211648 RepID=UPI003B8B7174